MIDHGPVNEPGKARCSVNLTAPLRCAGWAKEDQMFEAEQRFRFAITILLFQKSPERKPPMVPHDRGGAKSNYAASLLKSPAKIDIITGLMIFDIEAADVFEGPSIERHVTTWDVLGDGVGEQNMAGTAGRCCDTGLDPIPRRRGRIRAAHSRIIATHERAY